MEMAGVVFGHLIKKEDQQKAEYLPLDKEVVWSIVWDLGGIDGNAEKPVEKIYKMNDNVVRKKYVMGWGRFILKNSCVED